jgi:glutamine cyclotransferase
MPTCLTGEGVSGRIGVAGGAAAQALTAGRELKQRKLPLVILLALVWPVAGLGGVWDEQIPDDSLGGVPVHGYQLINIYPHSPAAFTQGLVYSDGYLYEGTGLHGGSSLRKVVIETGEVVKRRNLASAYFGEGVTIRDSLIYQLTWRNHVGFVYRESDEFELIGTFEYPTQGWGLTHDDTSLIMSDGSDRLYRLDPETFEEVGRVSVVAQGSPVMLINELELIRGRIYANILGSDSIAIIQPETGEVEGWINLAGILPVGLLAGAPGPLNGIAFDEEGARLFVTGKLWPSLFEIYVDPIDYAPVIVSSSPASPVWVHTGTEVVFAVIAEDGGPVDSLAYSWSVDGLVDPAACDPWYEYSSWTPTVDTVAVTVTDGLHTVSETWLVYVEIAGVADDPPGAGPVSGAVGLAQNRPNPFRRSTSIGFTIPASPDLDRGIRLSVHDVSGRQVRMLLDGRLPAGGHRVAWDGTDDLGRRTSGGIYFCVLRSGNRTVSRKMILLGS